MGHDFAPLFAGVARLKCPAGQILSGPYESPGVFLLRSGYVKAYDITPEGETQIINFYGAGDVFPFYWGIKGGEQAVYYEAMTSLTFSKVSREVFVEQVYEDIALLRAALESLLKMFRYYQLRIQNLEYQLVMERLAFRLVFLAEYYGKKERKHIQIQVPVIYQDLADSINATRDTVNRTMRQFIDDGLVARKGKRLTVLRVQKLKQIYGES